MRKYKHIQTGVIAKERLSYNDYSFNDNGIVYLPKKYIENSNDWEEIKEQPFKNGDVIKNEHGAIYLITDFENCKAYGFNSRGEWWYIPNLSLTFKLIPQSWQIVPKQEWLDALTKEAEKRYGKLKIGDKVKGHWGDKVQFITEIKDYYYTSSSVNQYFGVNGMCLMHNGIWAEVVKEETLEEFGEKFIDYLARSSGGTKKAYMDFFNENKETIHKLSK